jgi:hypothetical protein
VKFLFPFISGKVHKDKSLRERKENILYISYNLKGNFIIIIKWLRRKMRGILRVCYSDAGSGLYLTQREGK